MNVFVKYPSLENSYRQKFIDDILLSYPELKNTHYIITEKLHGANFQIIILPDGNFKFASRNRLLELEDDFYNFQEAIKDILPQLSFFAYIATLRQQTVRLYGELIGRKIQKGIDYGNDKPTIKFFDMMINDELMPPLYTITIFDQTDIKELFVPIVAFKESLDEALKFPNVFPTNLNPKPDNICEGVIIRPLHKNYYNKHGQIFILKNKNEKFAEKSKEKKTKVKEMSERDKLLIELNDEFKRYINKNRILNILSKEGISEVDKKDYGRIIKLVLEDAKQDFMKDIDLGQYRLDKSELKRIFNVGSMIVKELQDL